MPNNNNHSRLHGSRAGKLYIKMGTPSNESTRTYTYKQTNVGKHHPTRAVANERPAMGPSMPQLLSKTRGRMVVWWHKDKYIDCLRGMVGRQRDLACPNRARGFVRATGHCFDLH